MQGMQQFSGFKIDIYDERFKSFPNNAFETAELRCFVGLTAILHLFQRKKFTFLWSVIPVVA